MTSQEAQDTSDRSSMYLSLTSDVIDAALPNLLQLYIHVFVCFAGGSDRGRNN